MTDTWALAEIVRGLRERANIAEWQERFVPGATAVFREAAEALSTLSTEIAKLNAAGEKIAAQSRNAESACDILRDENAVLRRQLAEADEAIAYFGAEDASDNHIRWSNDAYARHKARHASRHPAKADDDGGCAPSPPDSPRFFHHWLHCQHQKPSYCWECHRWWLAGYLDPRGSLTEKGHKNA